MTEQITLHLPNSLTIQIPPNTPFSEIISELQTNPLLPPIAIRVNNSLKELSYIPTEECNVEPISANSGDGVRIYRRSLAFILARAVHELSRNIRLVIGHSLGNSYYYDLYADVPVSERLLHNINEKMQEIVKQNDSFIKKVISREDAIEFFRKEGYPDKVRLLTNQKWEEVTLCSCGTYTDIYYGPTVPSTSFLDHFRLQPYRGGVALCFPDKTDPRIVSDLGDPRRLFEIHQESKKWGRILRSMH